MINGVFDITTDQYQSIKNEFVSSPDTYLAEIDGSRIMDDGSFYMTIGTALGASSDQIAPVSNMNWFYDELTTLYWAEDESANLKYEQFILAFCHPDAIWTPQPWNFRKFFEGIANFWQSEVERVVIEGQVRGFAVYLVHET